MQLFYIAVLISAAVTVSITNEIDIFDNDADASRHADDGESFRAVAGWLIFIAICGIAFEIVMAVTRSFILIEVLVVKFAIYGMVVSLNNYVHRHTQTHTHTHTYVHTHTHTHTYTYIHTHIHTHTHTYTHIYDSICKNPEYFSKPIFSV